MWQIQWVLGLIPDALLNWIYWAIIAIGLTGVFAGWLGRFIPFYGRYVQFLKPIGVALLVLGVWLRGGYDVEMSWRAKVEALEAKVKESEARSNQANEDLSRALKDKNKKTQEVRVVIQERIREVEKKIDADCKIDSEAIDILNDSARNQKGAKK